MTAAIPDATPSASARVERARALLAGAEARLGVVRDFAVLPGGAQGASPGPASVPPARLLPVDSAVAGLLPGEALRRGTVVAVEGSTSLLLALVARASREGGWTAIVGMPEVGMVAAAGRGIDLARLALVPHPGAEAAVAAGACLDGMDAVLLGPRLALSDADRRRLVARARERGAVLLSAGPWTGAHVSLRVARSSWTGLGAGDGRLRARTLTVARSGRHLGAGDQRDVTLDVDAGLPQRAAGPAPAVGSASRYPGRARQTQRSLRLA